MDLDIGLLPDEVILHIFSNLGCEDIICARKVCRRWRNIGTDKYLWRSLKATFYGFRKHVNAPTFGEVVKKNSAAYQSLKVAPDILGGLELRGIWRSQFCAKLVSKVLNQHPKNIRNLRLTNCQIRENDLLFLLYCFGDQLEQLTIESVVISWNEGVTKTKIRDMPKLKTFAMDAFSFRNKILLPSNWPNLQELQLIIPQKQSEVFALWNFLEYALVHNLKSQTRKFTMRFLYVNSFVTVEPLKFLEWFPNLERLSFESEGNLHCNWTFGDVMGLDANCGGFFSCAEPKLFDTILKPSLAFESVQNLTMRFCYFSCDCAAIISRFIRKFPNLKKLTLVETCHEYLVPHLHNSCPTDGSSSMSFDDILFTVNLQFEYVMECNCFCKEFYRQSLKIHFENMVVKKTFTTCCRCPNQVPVMN